MTSKKLLFTLDIVLALCLFVLATLLMPLGAWSLTVLAFMSLIFASVLMVNSVVAYLD